MMAVRMLQQVLVVLLLFQAITGGVLAFMYVPLAERVADRMAPHGNLYATYAVHPVVTSHGTGMLDTISPGNEWVALPDATPSHVRPLSYASRSVEVDIANAPVGTFLRTVHHGTTSALVALAAGMLLLYGWQRCYAVAGSRWVAAIAVFGALLLAAWTGRLLPDDAYAEASRNATGSGLPEVPFGTLITDLFGVRLGHGHLVRAYAMHLLVLPVGIWACMAVPVRAFLRGRVGARRTLVVMALASGAVAASTLAGMLAEPPSTASIPSTTIGPWWMLRPAHSLAYWLGGELAGYVAFGFLVGALTLPWWHRRTAAWVPIAFLWTGAAVYILGVLV